MGLCSWNDQNVTSAEMMDDTATRLPRSFDVELRALKWNADLDCIVMLFRIISR
jgi:hypothetical protein